MKLKGVYIDSEMLVCFLHTWRTSTFICLPDLHEIPKDARVHRINYCPNHDAFYIVFEHPSFPEVNPACEIPTVISQTRMVSFKVGES